MRVNTNDQIWKLPDILEHFSRLLPLNPGDMFSTGAPGDVIECAIEGIATLRTHIA